MFFSEPKGFAIIMALAASVLRLFGSIGYIDTPLSSLFSAEARASGSPVRRAPSSSASNSRVRLIAI
ncbi:Uncharacterised protein [Mycobacterium tuberculosis]|nr:Uncharacterised protein [Mycobacterium tuberculosis]